MSEEFSFAVELRPRIDAALDKATRFGSGCPPRLAEAIRYCVLGSGKRLRPQLVLLAARACGADEQQAMPAAVAVELIHAYSLAHDDLPAMDDDDLRRGRPSCHRRFDEATAILAGDALIARAFEVLANDIQLPNVAARCCAELAGAAGAEALVGGQADDLAAEFRSSDVEQLQSIHRRKTGAMFRAAPRLGAIAVGADETCVECLSLFGERIGHAFQIVDDLLDVSGDENHVGKRTGQDDKRGKATYPALLGVEASQRRAAELIQGAQEAISRLGDASRPLVELAHFVWRRTY